jgi:predicted O-linked N-acetylglucosamine transferase (SPINDLY family)
MLEGNCSPSECRALVPLETEGAEPHSHRAAPMQAAFLAHLIASTEKVPQFCGRRRAGPEEAEAAYQEAIARFSAP